jgi:hypothetical protein
LSDLEDGMADDHEAAWRAIVDSADQAAAVRAHLTFLTGAAEDERLLDEVMTQFVAARTEAGNLVLVFRYREFDEELELECGPPFRGVAEGDPPSVVEITRVHCSMGWESYGGGGVGFYGSAEYGFGGSGGWDDTFLEDAAEDNAGFLAGLATAGLSAEDVPGCCDYGQNWLIWNPAEKNALGEPPIFFVSHGDCVARPVKAARDLPFGPFFLRLMVQGICGEDIFEEIYD